MSASDNTDNSSADLRNGQEAAAVSAVPRPAEQGGNVDKIRDILFGSQMREYESRFARLEETLLKESSDLRESTRKRIDTLESYIRKELDSLTARLRAERDDRLAATKDLSNSLANSVESLTQAIRQTQDAAGEGDRELRSHMLEQSNSLMDEIRAKHESVLTVLERRFQELRNSKTDRAALADLFTEVALRLNREFRVPDAES